MINEVRLIGNLGADPRMGNNVSRISVATEDKWKDRNSGEWMSKTQWHYVVCFGNMDQYARKWLQKGMQVYVEGSMEYGEYEKDGVTVRTAEVKAKKIKILGRKNDSDGGNTGTGYQPPSMGDDVPF